jgi:hypothetical protein
MEAKTATPKRVGKERGETKEQAEMETEEANQAKNEAKEAKEQAKREAEEAKQAKKAVAQAGKATAVKTEKGTDSELYKGEIKLAVMPPVDPGQFRKLEEHLSQVNDLSLVLIGGSATEGTEIIVSADNPLPLLDILREMPPVAEVTKKGKIPHITLKTE